MGKEENPVPVPVPSTLPDEILISILSLLTLKEASKTSILGGRWRYLWTYLPSLDFDSSHVKWPVMKWNHKEVKKNEAMKYVKWVNETLELHRYPVLDKFGIQFELEKSYEDDITWWLEFAISKRVGDLQVDLGHSGLDYFNSGFLPYTIPPMLHEYVNIEFLRSLSLAHVDITGEIIENILSVCSQLERLSVNTSSYLGGLIVAGSSLKLLFLEILVDSNMKDVYHISAPNLDSLVIGGAKVGLQVKFAPCLLHLDIKIPYRKSLQDALDGESMCYLRQLQTLVLKFSSNVVPKYLGQLPEMVNLKHLVLQAQPPIVGNGDHVLDAIRVLMKASPFLQKFTLQFYPFLRGKRKHAVTVESVADCFLQHLKLVEIEGFIGHQVCDELVTYFLDYGISLEKLIINARCFLNSAEAPRSSRKFAEEARAREWARQLQAKASSGVEFVIL